MDTAASIVLQHMLLQQQQHPQPDPDDTNGWTDSRRGLPPPPRLRLLGFDVVRGLLQMIASGDGSKEGSHLHGWWMHYLKDAVRMRVLEARLELMAARVAAQLSRRKCSSDPEQRRLRKEDAEKAGVFDPPYRVFDAAVSRAPGARATEAANFLLTAYRSDSCLLPSTYQDLLCLPQRTALRMLRSVCANGAKDEAGMLKLTGRLLRASASADAAHGACSESDLRKGVCEALVASCSACGSVVLAVYVCFLWNHLPPAIKGMPLPHTLRLCVNMLTEASTSGNIGMLSYLLRCLTHDPQRQQHDCPLPAASVAAIESAVEGGDVHAAGELLLPLGFVPLVDVVDEPWLMSSLVADAMDRVCAPSDSSWHLRPDVIGMLLTHLTDEWIVQAEDTPFVTQVAAGEWCCAEVFRLLLDRYELAFARLGVDSDPRIYERIVEEATFSGNADVLGEALDRAGTRVSDDEVQEVLLKVCMYGNESVRFSAATPETLFSVLLSRRPHLMAWLARPDVGANLAAQAAYGGTFFELRHAVAAAAAASTPTTSTQRGTPPPPLSRRSMSEWPLELRWPVLRQAIYGGNAAVVDHVLRKKLLSPDDQARLLSRHNSSYLMALTVACRDGKARTLRALLRGAHPSSPPDLPPEALYTAARNCHKGRRNHVAVLATLLQELNVRFLREASATTADTAAATRARSQSLSRFQSHLNEALVVAASNQRMTAVRMLLGKLRRGDDNDGKAFCRHLTAEPTDQALGAARAAGCQRMARLIQSCQ